MQAPASKSSMQRACAAALLREGESIIKNPGHSNDDKAAIEIIKALGAKIHNEASKLIVNSPGIYSGDNEIDPAGEGIYPFRNEINCGESGLSIRMFTPIAALSNKEISITGSGSLATRPMDFFDEVLPELGVKVKSNNGKLPIIIQGPLQTKNIEIDGSLSSQFLTGLLMAYGASPNQSEGGASEDPCNSKVSIRVRDLKSKPYIDLTLDVMKKFGMNVPENKNYEEFIFSKDSSPTLNHKPETINYIIEGDWSGAAFLLVAGTIAGPITIRGLDIVSTQADKAIIDALISANAGIAIEAKGIKIHPSPMIAFNFDATDCPDLFPPLVALAAYCDGGSTIKGISRLTHKESNRAITLQQEFGKMGVKVELNDDIMIIHGGKGVKGATVHSNHDHRIAMACAVAALKAEGPTTIEGAEAIKKSYPDFYNDLKSLGADVS